MPQDPSVAVGGFASTAAEVRRRTDRLSRVLDSAIGIPGTRFSFGLDALIGLFPVVGDFAGFAVGGWFLLEGARVGAPASLLAKMAGNIVADALIGFIPVIGDVADIAFKANRRNARLLAEYLDRIEPQQQMPALASAPARSRGAALLIAAVLAIALYGVWALAQRLLM